MANSRAAIRYATAILDLAKEQNIAEVINADMQMITSTVAESKELKMLLQSPIVKKDTKTATLKEIFATANPLTLKLVDVLSANKRLAIFATTATEYTALFDAANGFQKAVVTTAVPLTETMSAKVLAKVKELTGKEAIIENKVDERILGGFILRVGDLQYNASIANKFNNLKRTFSQN